MVQHNWLGKWNSFTIAVRDLYWFSTVWFSRIKLIFMRDHHQKQIVLILYIPKYTNPVRNLCRQKSRPLPLLDTVQIPQVSIYFQHHQHVEWCGDVWQYYSLLSTKLMCWIKQSSPQTVSPILADSKCLAEMENLNQPNLTRPSPAFAGGA